MQRTGLRRFSAAFAGLAAAVPVVAQEQVAQAPVVAGGIEDIVVTAQRRAERLQDVPIAVTAFTQESLESRGITNTLQLISYVPNMFGSNNTGLGSANAYYLRGLGNTETVATFDPPVGTYVDDIYLSRQNGNNFAFFDVERVEVLRGPQGTLFGRNTTGGAVNVILRRPGETLGGFVEAGYGSYRRWMVRGSVDLPFGDFAGLKLSGYYQDDRGYAINTTTGERLNDHDMAGFRVAAQVRPLERLTWNVALAYMDSNGENILNFPCDPRNPSNCRGRFATTGMRSTAATGGAPLYTVPIAGRKAGFPLGNEVATTLFTSNLEWGGETHTLNLITGILGMNQDFALDFADGRALPNVANARPPVRGFVNGGFTILNEGSHTQVTQEIKLTGRVLDGRVNYVTGLYLYDEKNKTDFADLFTVDTGTPAGLPLVLADRFLVNGTRAWAGYGQVDWTLADALTLTAGIRYTDERKSFDIRDNRASCIANPAPLGCLNANIVASNGAIVPLTQRAKVWTPRFAVNYRPDPGLLLFASATKGFKSGGWNARGTDRRTLLPFDPEIVWSYEAGVKSDWLGNRLRVNVTGFWMDVDDLQTPSAFVNPATGAISFITQNFADYQNRGVELEVQAAPVSGLSLYANVGWQRDRYRVSDSLAPNRFGIKSVRQQQLDCRAQLAAGQIPLGVGPRNAPDCAAGIIDANGDIATPVRTPDWSLAFGGTYEVPLGGVLFAPSVNVIYRSNLEVGTSNATIYEGPSPPTFDGFVYPFNPFGGAFVTGSQSRPGFLVNAALAVRTVDNGWLLSLECENCLDREYVQSALANYTYLNPPRTWMVRARRAF